MAAPCIQHLAVDDQTLKYYPESACEGYKKPGGRPVHTYLAIMNGTPYSKDWEGILSTNDVVLWGRC